MAQCLESTLTVNAPSLATATAAKIPSGTLTANQPSSTLAAKQPSNSLTANLPSSSLVVCPPA